MPYLINFCQNPGYKLFIILLESDGQDPKYAPSKHGGLFYMMRCANWYHLHNLKNVKNTNGGVLLQMVRNNGKQVQNITYRALSFLQNVRS